MATLTADYDAVVEISQELLERFVVHAYFDGRVATEISLAFSQDPFQGRFAARLLPPQVTLQFTPVDQGIPAVLRLIFPLAGSILVFAPSTLAGTISLDGASLTVDAPLEFMDVLALADPPEDLNATYVKLDLAYAEYRASITDPQLDSGFRVLLQNLVRTQGRRWFGTGVPPWFALPFPGSVYQLRTRHSDNAAEAYLACFMQLGHRPGLPVGAFTTFITADDHVAVALSADQVQRMASAQIRETFGGNLPAHDPSDNDTIVQTLEMQLMDGFIQISGTATNDTILGTLRISFFARAVFEGTEVRIVDVHPDVETPIALDLLAAFLPGLGAIVFVIVNELVKSMAEDSVVRNADFTLPDLTFVARRVVVTPEGMVIHGKLSLGNFLGNRRTQELHLGWQCQWVYKMNPSNLVRFERYQDAFEQGYNGCRYCMRRVDTG